MAENTKIEWTDHTFNPWRGCKEVHPGCDNCYARVMSLRNPATLGTWGENGTRVVASEAQWKLPLKWNRQAQQRQALLQRHPEIVEPYRRPRVFCASLADVFDDWSGPMVDSRGRRLFACPHCGVVDHTQQGLDGFVEQGSNGSGEVLYDCCETLVVVRPATMDDVRRRLFALIDATPHLDWLLVTKRPENVRRMWPSADVFDDKSEHKAYWPNVWLLTSVSDQATADVMIPELLKCRDLVPVLGISAEPLLGRIDMREFVGYGSYNGNIPGRCVNIDGESIHAEGRKCRQCGWGYPDDPDYPRRVAGLDWVIVGGESGHGARPMHPDWARWIRDQCTAAGVPFFFKQWGDFLPISEIEDAGTLYRSNKIAQDDQDQEQLDDIYGRTCKVESFGLQYDGQRGWNGGDPFHIPYQTFKVGKKAAGRLLDGREWNEFPGVVHA